MSTSRAGAAGILTPALATAAAFALALVPAAGASAHDALESSSPAAGESVTADPGTLSLTYSDTLMAIGETTDGFAVQVTDAEGMHYESGCVAIADSSVTTPIALGDAGGYTVTWQVVSSDGHPTSGQYEFDYSPATLEGAHDGLTDPAVCGEPWAGEPDGAGAPAGEPASEVPSAPAAEAGSAATPSPASDTAGAAAADLDVSAAALPGWAVVLIVLAGLGVLAAIVVLVLRRMRAGGDDPR
ncbi:copper resistance protein CopC [Herbiconiux sp. CPCC 203407]|uniref:Copper resistance protein CopC n=1 Tax=Herbiconiux oxytropis TaxID=2970915 RepID=A0AA41XGC2_9MICO|nr:copper resistance CopC family protein [Herbiconiux oxytropis]MCS5723602.1 copper resistance protein CopC [Herbiconiux oxytropis]MCS5727692.1 copper resistance protein CopC [Herbiconiux oxytropis]